MNFDCRFISLVCALLIGLGALLQAEESFEDHVHKLADNSYAVRAASIKALVKMCRSEPQWIERLAPVILDEKGDPERIFSARKVILQLCEEIWDLHFPQPKSIGIELTKSLKVRSVIVGSTGDISGITHSMRLVSVAGKSVEGKTPADIDAMIQATRTGTSLEMGLAHPDGRELFFYPVVGGKMTDYRRIEIYNKWLELMRNR